MRDLYQVDAGDAPAPRQREQLAAHPPQPRSRVHWRARYSRDPGSIGERSPAGRVAGVDWSRRQRARRREMGRRGMRVSDEESRDPEHDQDRPHPVQVRLPFKVTEKFRGDDTAIADERKKMEKQRARLLDYLTGLARDPSKDPELQKQLDERGLHLRAPKAVSFEERMSTGAAGGIVDDILPKEYRLDGERWTKFYMKIAWCFACLKLGRARLIGLRGEQVLGYLRSGRVDPRLVDEVRKQDQSIAIALFRDASIDGEISWLWSGTLDEARQQLALAPPSVVAQLGPVLQRRSEAQRVASTWVKASGMLDRAAGVPGAEHRYHQLRLQRVVVAEQTALVCEIKLFGGICVATVQLTPLLSVGALDGIEAVEAMIRF